MHPFWKVFRYICMTQLAKITILLSCQPRVTVRSCFVYKVLRDIESIDHLCINLIRRIGLIHNKSIDSRLVKCCVQDNVLVNNCKQNNTSLSLLVGTTVPCGPLQHITKQ